MLKKITHLFLIPAICGLLAAGLLLFIATKLPSNSKSTHNENYATGAVVSYADAVSHASNSVVNIYSTRFPESQSSLSNLFLPGPPDNTEQPIRSLGSGVIASSQGYILTNNHVVVGADQIQVLLQDGRSALASIVGSDPETDLAVLKINLPNLQPIEFGNPDKIRVGDVVLAIGNPYGFGNSVSQGIVSATHRYSENIRVYEGYLQTDAAINPGNSGGALIDAYGRLIGINTFILSKSGGNQGIGLAVPVDIARQVLEDIIKTGHARHGWIGIVVQQLHPQIAHHLNLNMTQGVLTVSVAPNSPAFIAGLKSGDIITHINKTPLNNSWGGGIQFASLRPGDNAVLQVLRPYSPEKIEPLELTIHVGERPAN